MRLVEVLGGLKREGLSFAGEMESGSNGVSQGFTFFILVWCMGGHCGRNGRS